MANSWTGRVWGEGEQKILTRGGGGEVMMEDDLRAGSGKRLVQAQGR